MSKKNIITLVVVVAIAVAAYVLFVQEKSPADHFEDAGDSLKAGLEQTMDDAGDAAEDAGDAMEDAAEDATE